MRQDKYFNPGLLQISPWIFLVTQLLIVSCTVPSDPLENIIREDSFLLFRRQSHIGHETYTIETRDNSSIVTSLQGENERGRISGIEAVMHLDSDLSPTFYENRRLSNDDSVNQLKVVVAPDSVSVWELDHEVQVTAPDAFFPLHSNISAAMEMMLYHYYSSRDKPGSVPTLPRGEITMTHKKKDTIPINGETVLLDRYVVEGINWGYRTIWLDQSNNLVAIVYANTQFREIIRKGYEEALPYFVKGNVEEQMSVLAGYTSNLKGDRAPVTALVGGDLIDGLSDSAMEDMVLIVKDDKIATIGPRATTRIPEDARIIDVTGKILMPGLWDMHAHSNQVQWAPAYLAGGITTFRDLGNELEFATAFRDAIALKGALGPDILLGGMVDGAGIKGNGVIRATTPEEARSVVAMYHEKGYRQIKIYTSVKPEIVKILAEEAHKKGMTVTGHVPKEVGNTIAAVELGMDQLNHKSLFLSVLFPDKDVSELGRFYLADTDVSLDQIEKATLFLLRNKTVLDPTIALDIIRNLPKGTPVETVEPGALQIAYELFEGKRFYRGVSMEQSVTASREIAKSMEIIGKFFRAGVPIVAGTDNVVPVYSLYLEIEAYHEFAGLTPLEAIQTATIIPARVMGLDGVTGTLEQGKEADIAILDKNPLQNIHHIRSVIAVMSNGNYYESGPLWKAADFKTK